MQFYYFFVMKFFLIELAAGKFLAVLLSVEIENTSLFVMARLRRICHPQKTTNTANPNNTTPNTLSIIFVDLFNHAETAW